MQGRTLELRASLVSVALAAAVSLLSPALASAAIRYAEPNGNGPEPCDVSDPCDIQQAAEAPDVEPGDEVILAPGDYMLTTSLDGVEVLDAITLHGQAGQPRPRLVASAANNTALFSNQAGTIIRHVEIEQGSGTSGLFMFAGTAEDVIVHSTTTGDTTACQAVNATIRDSVCWNSGGFGNGVGINLGGGGASGTITLRNVTAVSSAAANSRGIFLGAGGGAISRSTRRA